MRDRLDTMTLDTIMARWPATVRVFVDWRLHCVGCPIANFHGLGDSAAEHGYPLDALKQAVQQAIEIAGASSSGPLALRRRSAAGDAAP